MFHFCDFCQTKHSSISCYHPGKAKYAELQEINGGLKIALETERACREGGQSKISSLEMIVGEMREALAPLDLIVKQGRTETEDGCYVGVFPSWIFKNASKAFSLSPEGVQSQLEEARKEISELKGEIERLKK